MLGGASLLALLLAGGGLFAWVDSTQSVRVWTLDRGVRTYSMSYAQGAAYLQMQVDSSPNRLDVSRLRWDGFLWHTVWNQGASSASGGPPAQGKQLMFWRIGCPLWGPMLLGVVLGAWCVRGWRRHRWDRRIRLGHCPHCGYDIRAAAGVCPECGSKLVAAS